MAEYSWRDARLFHGASPTGFSVVPDQQHPRMWRVRYPDGRLSDMTNRTRAKDAAEVIYRMVSESVQGRPYSGLNAA